MRERLLKELLKELLKKALESEGLGEGKEVDKELKEVLGRVDSALQRLASFVKSLPLLIERLDPKVVQDLGLDIFTELFNSVNELAQKAGADSILDAR